MAGAEQALAPLVRDCVAAGRFDPLIELLAEDAILDTSSESGRRRIQGPAEIAAHLAGPGPGEVLDWDAREWPSGLAATFEWRGASGVDRRRWYVRRREDGAVTGIWSYSARPRSVGGAQTEVPAAVLERIGGGARRAPLVHSGNSGAALERVILADGATLIAKRVGPASDWLGRVTAIAGAPRSSGRRGRSRGCRPRSTTGSRRSSPTVRRGGW